MKYRYSGPTSGATLRNDEDETKYQEIMLHTGAEVDLPEGHEYTKTLLALGHLTPTSVPSRQPSKTSGRSSTGTDEPAAKGA